MVGRRLYRFKFGLPVRVSIVDAEPSPRVPGIRLYPARYTKFSTSRVKRACPSQRSRSRESRTSRSSSRAPYRKSGQCRDFFRLARQNQEGPTSSLFLSLSLYIYTCITCACTCELCIVQYVYSHHASRVRLIAADHTSCRRVKAS